MARAWATPQERVRRVSHAHRVRADATATRWGGSRNLPGSQARTPVPLCDRELPHASCDTQRSPPGRITATDERTFAFHVKHAHSSNVEGRDVPTAGFTQRPTNRSPQGAVYHQRHGPGRKCDPHLRRAAVSSDTSRGRESAAQTCSTSNGRERTEERRHRTMTCECERHDHESPNHEHAMATACVTQIQRRRQVARNMLTAQSRGRPWSPRRQRPRRARAPRHRAVGACE